MRKTTTSLIICALLLAGCGGGGWFGRGGSDDAAQSATEEDNPLIPEQRAFSVRPPDIYEGTTIDTVNDLFIERVPGGIIIRATGQSARFGAFNAQLTPRTKDEAPVDGVLTYVLEAEYTETVASSPSSRSVIVARKLTDQELGDTRTIRVEGLQNALERRR